MIRHTRIIGFLLVLMTACPVYADINSDLLKAARKGDWAVVKTLIGKGADVNAKNQKGHSALMVATIKGHTSIVQKLLDNGADVNAKTKSGGTVLFTAAGRGHSDIVQVLLDNGADVNAKSSYGMTALSIAFTRPNKKVILILLAHGADPNSKIGNSKTTVLIEAASHNMMDIARELLDKGADVNAKNDDGFTSLDLAKANLYVEMVELLKQYGAKEWASTHQK